MNCFSNNIELDNTIPSRSDLYADSLPGIDVELIDGLSKSGNDADDTWALLYKRACDNLVSDVSKFVQNKFHVNFKQVARETSGYLTTYNSAGIAGVKLTFNLSKYSKVHILSVGVWSQIAYTNAIIRIYDTDENGELLETITEDLALGRNTVNVDSEFETNVLFISINTATYSVKNTENKYYHSHFFDPVVCSFNWPGGTGNVEQINGGGVNVKYVVYCSVQKFVCENLPLFNAALLWKIGVEISNERRYGERLNRFTTMQVERFIELGEYYKTQYDQELSGVLKSQNIQEDSICFNCKDLVSVQTQLP